MDIFPQGQFTSVVLEVQLQLQVVFFTKMWDPKTPHMFGYGYGSIPINSNFRGINIHLPAILMFTRGIGFWHTAIWLIWLYELSIPISVRLGIGTLNSNGSKNPFPHWTMVRTAPHFQTQTSFCCLEIALVTTVSWFWIPHGHPVETCWNHGPLLGLKWHQPCQPQGEVQLKLEGLVPTGGRAWNGEKSPSGFVGKCGIRYAPQNPPQNGYFNGETSWERRWEEHLVVLRGLACTSQCNCACSLAHLFFHFSKATSTMEQFQRNMNMNVNIPPHPTTPPHHPTPQTAPE